MNIGSRLTLWRKGFEIDPGSWLRQTGPGYIQTDIPWDSTDIIIGTQSSAASGITRDRWYIVASVSKTNFTSSDIANGNSHGWSWFIGIGGANAIGMGTADGVGTIYKFYLDPGSYINTPSSSPPVFNTITYTTYYGWGNEHACMVNGLYASNTGGSGTMTPTFPSQNLVLFAHANPNGSVIDVFSQYGAENFKVHSIFFKHASNGIMYRNFVAANIDGVIGMYDTVTKKFFPATGSFEYGTGGTYVPLTNS